ncbi:hypothetical protein YTPLAS72_02890 [Nitrospira sp.]|nr:hypothetical protein YTPLAS72_02890 [Nitrospira sp.]
MAMPETLRGCSSHATRSDDANTCSWLLYGHHEEVADRIADQFHQWIGIDSEHEND